MTAFQRIRAGGVGLFAAFLTALTFMPVLMLSTAQAADETAVGLERRSSVALTVYNADLAMIRDVRRIDLAKGPNRLAFGDVSGRLRPETARLGSAAGDRVFTVQELNFDFDQLSQAKLLQASVGQNVRVVRTHPTTGADTLEEAEVLSVAGGVVLRIGDRIETGSPGRIVFDSIPAGLRARPTLVAVVDSPRAASVPVELSYLSGGLRWQADYVGNYDEKAKRLDLQAWVTLTNTSGSDYRDAKLRLVAGDVNVSPQPRPELKEARMAMADAAPARGVSRAKAFDYHVYGIARPITLADNQTKQIALMRAGGIPVVKEYRLESFLQLGRQPGKSKQRIAVWLTFENGKEAGFKEPLPQGIVRIYRAATDGDALFLGEDRIAHTPIGEEVELRMGSAFDLTAERRQTAFQRPGSSRNLYEAAYELVLRNADKEAATVIVTETIPGDWEMLAESQPHKKIAANKAEWRVAVPAGGSATLTYRARVRQ